MQKPGSAGIVSDRIGDAEPFVPQSNMGEEIPSKEGKPSSERA